MAIKKNKEAETGYDCYYRHLSAKISNLPWIYNIEVDPTTIRANDGKCLSCGNPNMDDCLDGATCKTCGIKRLMYHQMTREEAENYHAYIQTEKAKSVKYWADLRRMKDMRLMKSERKS